MRNQQTTRPSGGKATVLTVATACLVVSAATAAAQTPVDAEALRIFKTTLEKRNERWAGVDNYTLFQSMNGAPFTMYYEKVMVDGEPAFRLVHEWEYEAKQFEEAGMASGMPDFGGAAAGGAGGFPSAPGSGGAARASSQGGMPESDVGGRMENMGGMLGGLPFDLPVPEGMPQLPEIPGVGDLASRLPDVPNVPSAPGSDGDGLLGTAMGAATGALQQRLMQEGMKALMKEAEGEKDDGSADARMEHKMFETLSVRARLTGRETVDGWQTFVLVADELEDLELGQEGEEVNFTLHTITAWIDVAEYVSRRSVIEGDVMIDGQAQPVRFEIQNQDYRWVESMFEPFRRSIGFEGMAKAMAESMDPKDMKELEESIAEFENVKAELAKMPEAQRKMIEERMGGSLEAMMDDAAARMRAFSTGDMSDPGMVTEVEDLLVNAGPPTKFGRGDMTAEGDVTLTVPRTIVTVGTGTNPEDGGTLSMIQLMGGIEGESFAIVQLNIEGPYPEAGTTTEASAFALLQWHQDKRQVGIVSQENGATVTVTSRAGNRIRGEYTFEGSAEVPQDGGGTKTIRATVYGTFDAPVPQAVPERPGMNLPGMNMP